MKKLIFIVGETATGKTDLALELANLAQSKQQTSTGILNSDSVQMYKELNIGSAKPNFSIYPDINFYLFDEISAPQVGTAGFFRKKALDILKDKLQKEILFLVGGSGFYLQALEKGMYPVESSSTKAMPKILKDTDLNLKSNQNKNGKSIQNKNFNLDSPLLISHDKSNLSSKSQSFLNEEDESSKLKELYQELETKDSKTAKKISPRDKYRILRALALIKTEDKTMSQIKKEFKKQALPWPYLKIGLKIPKEELLKRVQQRTKNMLKKGLIDETQALIDKGLKNWKPLRSVGYKEVLLYLENQIKKEELEPLIVSKTMQLAKKQRTWFKKDQNIKWLDWNLPALKVYKELFK